MTPATPQQALLRSVENRLKARWLTDLTSNEPTDSWPHKFPTGLAAVPQDDLQARWADLHQPAVHAWRNWAEERGLEVVEKPRRVWTVLDIPTHIQIHDIDQAARLVAGEWPKRINRAGNRLAILRERFPNSDHPATIRTTDRYADLDFDLLLTVADWYLADPTRAALGVTPRQVPLPGVHAKWLQDHKAGVQAVTGLSDLGLLPRHPARIHFTYLDPAYRATGGRMHDSATVGDTFTPPYEPAVVVISENKDTAIHFPPIPGGIAVEGVGKGGKTPASFQWLRDASFVIYWGDIDSDGYEILDGYRADFQRDIDSILMDPATYDTYQAFGTNTDRNGNLLTAGEPKSVQQLHTDEREVYLRLLRADHAGYRRIEQERIPLEIAVEEVRRRTGL